MATEQQRKFGALPIGKPKRNGRPLTDAELDAGMTVEQMREIQQKQRRRVLKRYGIKAFDVENRNGDWNA